MKRLYGLFCLLFVCLWPTLIIAAEIKDMRLAAYTPDTVRFVADLSQKAEANVFRLENPHRLVVDFEKSSFSPTARKKKLNGTGFIKSVRTGTPDPDKARIVFDLPSSPLTMKNFFLKPTGSNGWRFVLDLSSANAPAVVPAAKTKPERTVGLQPFGNTSKKSRVIVLDPGHGGQDPGAISRSGQAHEAHADLFISIHADSAKNRSARGLSVYTVSEKASDAEAAALAERENKADILFDVDLSEYEADVGNMLIDFAKKHTMDQSAQYASYVVQEMKRKVQLVPNAHRMAGFVVLKSPNIPSVLVELGYLSNKTEERLLQQKSYRRKLAEALAKAVDTYFDTLIE